jgi:hypothetical protein
MMTLRRLILCLLCLVLVATEAFAHPPLSPSTNATTYPNDATQFANGIGTFSQPVDPPGSLCNMLFDDGATWDSITPGGDVVCDSVLGGLDLGGQEKLPYQGPALASNIPGEFRATDGAGHMVVATMIYPVPFQISGTPSSSMTFQIYIPWALNFNANFASSTGVPAAGGGCTTAPSEPDDWQINCPVSGTLIHIGDLTFPTNCGTTTNPPTFTTVSGTAKSCGAGFYQFTAPATVSGANLAATLPGHN